MTEKATIKVDSEIHRKLKIEAAKLGMTVGELAERSIAGSISFEAYFKMMKEECESYEGRGEKVIRNVPALFRLLTEIYRNDRISREGRLLVVSALGYFLIPYDVIPEAVHGPEGYIDDGFLCLHVLKRMAESEDKAQLREAWKGEADIIELIGELYKEAEHLVGEDKEKILQYVGLKEG